jgi:hypothetical protein
MYSRSDPAYNGVSLSTKFYARVDFRFTWGGPMENISSLRRQAAFCLRFAELCSDKQLANHLQFKAAEYHQRALRSEFNLQQSSCLAN